MRLTDAPIKISRGGAVDQYVESIDQDTYSELFNYYQRLLDVCADSYRVKPE